MRRSGVRSPSAPPIPTNCSQVFPLSNELLNQVSRFVIVIPGNGVIRVAFNRVNPVQIEFIIHLLAAGETLPPFFPPEVEFLIKLLAPPVFVVPFLAREKV